MIQTKTVNVFHQLLSNPHHQHLTGRTKASPTYKQGGEKKINGDKLYAQQGNTNMYCALHAMLINVSYSTSFKYVYTYHFLLVHYQCFTFQFPSYIHFILILWVVVLTHPYTLKIKFLEHQKSFLLISWIRVLTHIKSRILELQNQCRWSQALLLPIALYQNKRAAVSQQLTEGTRMPHVVQLIRTRTSGYFTPLLIYLTDSNRKGPCRRHVYKSGDACHTHFQKCSVFLKIQPVLINSFKSHTLNN